MLGLCVCNRNIERTVHLRIFFYQGNILKDYISNRAMHSPIRNNDYYARTLLSSNNIFLPFPVLDITEIIMKC